MKLSRKQQERYLSHKNYRRYLNSLRRKAVRDADLLRAYKRYLKELKEYSTIIREEDKFLSFSPNIEYLYNSKAKFKEGHFFKDNKGRFYVPKEFCLIENPRESYAFIYHLFHSLRTQSHSNILIDYSKCEKIALGAQIYMDIILKDFIKFLKKCDNFGIHQKIQTIRGLNVDKEDIRKILFSVGSQAILAKQSIDFPDIISYKLCERDREKNIDPVKAIEQKDIDTTTLVDYVLDSLKKTANKELTAEKRGDLCQVIGEVLINAEEHSSTRYRYSVGYCKDIREDGKHYGLFNLVIFNFGQTIYEKFADPNCPTQHIVTRMKELSQKYTSKRWFLPKSFEEESLWTLYALQDGVTSKVNYPRRGNGCIQFIESFLNIKGKGTLADDVSRMTILSGNTKITFEGSYSTAEKKVGSETYKIMTFNASNDIEEPPDKKNVTFVEEYFPGTMICATILFNDDDFIKNVEQQSQNN